MPQTEFKAARPPHAQEQMSGASPEPRPLSSPKRHCTPLPPPGALLPSPELTEAACSLSSGPVVGGVGGPPGQHPPPPPPGPRPPHGLAARTQLAPRSWLSPGESVGHRVDALSAQLPLNHTKGNLPDLGLRENGRSSVLCHLFVPHHFLQGPQHARPVGTQQVSVSESKGLVPARLPQPLGGESPLERGSQTSCPLPRGPLGIADTTAPTAALKKPPGLSRLATMGVDCFSEEQPPAPQPLRAGMALQAKSPRWDCV